MTDQSPQDIAYQTGVLEGQKRADENYRTGGEIIEDYAIMLRRLADRVTALEENPENLISVELPADY